MAIATQERLDETQDSVRGRQVQARRAREADRGARAAVALARSKAEQVTIRRSQVQTNQKQQAAAAAQQAKADVRLAYTEIHAPIDGIVDVRAARAGEVVNAGQPIVTLINPDDLWVRADVEETYIDRVRIGDTLTFACRPATSARARCSTAASTPASPPSATSAAPSATSRRSRFGCAWTTRIAASPSA